MVYKTAETHSQLQTRLNRNTFFGNEKKKRRITNQIHERVQRRLKRMMIKGVNEGWGKETIVMKIK
jgi:dephospho-CoA kinase